MKSTKIYRGTIVYAPQLGALECLEHAYLVAQNGVIAGVFQELPGKYQDTALEDFGDCLLIPSIYRPSPACAAIRHDGHGVRSAAA